MHKTAWDQATLTLLHIDNPHASAVVSLFGAQVLSYIPRSDGRERLFISPRARLDGSKSIRGGVPLCWPWFGAHPDESQLPLHGYARHRHWQLDARIDDADGTRLLLRLPDPGGLGFSGEASLQLEILIGRQLSLCLQTRNAGRQAFRLSCALHSYFAVDDILGTELRGLSGEYSDKNRDWARGLTPAPYRFEQATDRIHLCAPTRLQLLNGQQQVYIDSAGHDSIVVWNPWQQGAAALPDMAAGDYRQMLCVETALTQGYSLAPGAEHRLQQTIC